MAVEATDPRVQELLNSLAIPDVSKVLGSKVEPLRVPHYKLLTLEELEKVIVHRKDDPLPYIVPLSLGCCKKPSVAGLVG